MKRADFLFLPRVVVVTALAIGASASVQEFWVLRSQLSRTGESLIEEFPASGVYQRTARLLNSRRLGSDPPIPGFVP